MTSSRGTMSVRHARSIMNSVATIVSMALLAVSCGDSATEPSATGPLEIVTEVRDLRDESRPTPPNGDFGGLPDRTVRIHLWYADSPPGDNPACRNGACGLVLVAHGFGGFATVGFDVVAGVLARAGYVVASVRFPLTNREAPGGYFTGIVDVVDQPGDLSFVVDRLLAASATRGDPLAGRIDPERIGTLGHSLGGVTALAQSRFDCCTDDRVGAVVLVGANLPAGEALFATTPLPVGPPTLLLSGTEDTLAPPELAPEFYAALTAPRTMVVLEGADHTDLILSLDGAVSPTLETSTRLLVAYFNRYIGHRARLVETLRRLEAEGHQIQHEDAGGAS